MKFLGNFKETTFKNTRVTIPEKTLILPKISMNDIPIETSAKRRRGIVQTNLFTTMQLSKWEFEL